MDEWPWASQFATSKTKIIPILLFLQYNYVKQKKMGIEIFWKNV